MHQPPANDRTRWERIDIDLKSESLAVPIGRCQDANTITMYGLSKSLTIKFLFGFQYFEIFCSINFSLFMMVDWI